MSEPIVSVIMPAYNCSRVIGQAIESVLVQTVPLELIIIDDCGREPLSEVMRRYEGEPRIRYLKNERNLGVASTRNRGVQASRGKYVAFLDADDWWSEEKLRLQLNLMERSGVVLCSTARELAKSSGQLTGRIIGVKEKIDYRSLLFNNEISCSSAVLLADVAREFPMERDEMHEDYITWLRILRKYKIAAGINQPLLKYRMSAQSKSGNKIKSARMTYNVYRFLGYNHLQSCRYFLGYAYNGFRKHVQW